MLSTAEDLARTGSGFKNYPEDIKGSRAAPNEDGVKPLYGDNVLGPAFGRSARLQREGNVWMCWMSVALKWA